MKKILFLALFAVAAASLSAVDVSEEFNNRADAAMKITDEVKFKKEAKALAKEFERDVPVFDREDGIMVVDKADCGKSSWAGYPYETIITALWKWAHS